MRGYQSMVLIAFLVCWASCGYTDEGPTIETAGQTIFPTRVLGSIAAIGDSITQAYNAQYTDFGSCRYRDNPEYSFVTNTTSNTTMSIAERAAVYKGSGVATANFGSDGAKMTIGYDQAQAAKTWALTQAAPRLITVFLGHNDICGSEKDKYRISCSRTSQDPNNYCRTSTFHYEQQMRQMLDVLITIPSSQIAVIHPIRVSQLCNFAREKVIDEWWLTRRCEDLWATPNLIGEDAVCPSLTSCSAERVADAYTTWVSYREIGNKVVEEYNLYAGGQTIPYNSTYGTGNVVRASSVSLHTTDVLGNSKFMYRDATGNIQLSVCECYHPSKYGQNQLAGSLWDGVTCSATTPCCNDTIEGDSDYNRGLCNNYTTSGSMGGLWYTGEGKVLTVARAGSGAGMVTSTPDGINCRYDCSKPYAQGTAVTLTATPDAGSYFMGWSAPCPPGDSTCTLTLTADTEVTATFKSAVYLDTVQKLYIGYYQRPADPEGMIFWASALAEIDTNHDGNFTGEKIIHVLAQFAYSNEAQALYGGDITGSNIATVVDSIYLGLFGRHAEQEGLDFYVNGFNSGGATPANILWQIMNGAQGTDAQAIQNRLVAARRFTQIIDPDLDGSPPFQANYAGLDDCAKTRQWLAGVTWDPATIPAPDVITTWMKNNIADQGDPIFSH